MGYGMRPTLGFPTPVRWATNPSTTEEPAESRKDTGANTGEKPPAKEWNWLINSFYKHTQYANASVVSNWFNGEALTASPPYLLWVVFHPQIGHWLTADPDTIWRSADGKNWIDSIAVSGCETRNGAGIDLTRYLFCVSGTSAQLKYSTNGAVWSTETVSSSPALFGISTAMCTKYPDSNFAIVGSSLGKISYSTTGIGGTWLNPTTGPTTTVDIRTICRIGTEKFIIHDESGATFISDDNGDTWSATAGKPSDVVPFVPINVNHMAVNVDLINTPQRASTVVVVGKDTSGDPAIAVSHDDGTSWSQASIVEDSYTAYDRSPQSVYYCGGDIWVSAGTSINDSSGYYALNVLISYDNGDTWRRASYNTSHEDAVGSLYSIGSDGKQLIAVGFGGLNVHSLAVPNSMNG